MAGQGHGEGFSDTRTNEIPDGSPPKIGRDLSGTSCACAGRSPSGREAFDWSALTMEHPRTDRSRGSLKPFGDPVLVDQDLGQIVVVREVMVENHGAPLQELQEIVQYK